MNLIEIETKKKRDQTFPVAILLLALIVVSLLVASVHSDKEIVSRPLQIEEKEVLILALNRLETDLPKMGEWTDPLKEELIKSSLKIYVSDEKPLSTEHLFHVSALGIAVSPVFFTTDPITQENALVRFVTERNVPPKDSSEIATTGE